MKSLSFTLNTAAPAIATSTSTATVSLHQLVDQLMDSFIPLAVNQKSFIINDVDKSFQLHADEQVLAFVVGNLLNNAITSSQSVCIRIEAVRKPEGIQIMVRNNGSHFYSTVAHGFSQVVAAARSLGGNINIYNQRHEGTVITLSMAA
ncbi:HAMP domain-containing histidine kinase [Niastella caeni]|uniref:histidine kinase n=1 Tax=Niastella caeni TaxID=2569763 RepID=A0A4S8HKU0_9BACT|nr:HAMP domain-containing histidine kinase [Niastella caeni]THU35827.1 HAMP domain-containing histidine kinase [Niastella caeni]